MTKTEEEIREARREAGKLRARKFYADKANKERVLEKKSTKYEVVKQKEGKAVTRRPRKKTADEVVEVIQPPQPEPPTRPQFRTFTQEVVHVPANKPSQPKAKPTANRVVVSQEVIQVPAPIVDNKLEITEMLKVPTRFTLDELIEDFKIFIKKAMKPTDQYKFIEVSFKTPVHIVEPVNVPSPPQSSKPSTRSPRVKVSQPVQEPVPEPAPAPVQEPVQIEAEDTTEPENVDEVYNKVERLLMKTNLTSAQKYAHSLKTVIKVLNPKDYNDFVRMLKNEPEQSFYKLTTYEFKPNQLYKSNSLKTYVHGIIVFLTYIKTGITDANFELWNDEWKILKVGSKEVTALKKLTEVVPTFEDFFNKVKENYPEYSVQVLLMKLYQRFPKRSDFYLKVVKNKKDAKDMKENYLVMNGNTATLVINAHKTSNGKTEEHPLDDEMRNYLKEYIKEKDIKVGEYLIKNKNMSDTVSKMKQKLGYLTGGAINFIRQVRTSDEHNDPKTTKKKQLQLAKDMNHSLASNDYYIRNHEPKK